MKQNENINPELIITVASAKEIDPKFFIDNKISLVYLNNLKHDNFSLPNLKRAVLIVITGVGKSQALIAAKLIIKKIKPKIVLNIGAAAGVNKNLKIGDWVIPSKIIEKKSKESISIDQYIFPIEKIVKIYKNKLLISSSKPLYQPLEDEADIADMETFYLAKIFIENDIKFYAIKRISDFPNRHSKDDYLKSLDDQKKEINELILKFLDKNLMKSVSVVIPSFNRAESLKNAIQSVIDQTIKANEIIVVDDGSTDNTEDIVKSFQADIIYIKNISNTGVSGSRNKAIMQASSEYIAFLDSDDIWLKNKLKNQLRYLYIYPFYMMVQSNEIWIRNDKRVNPKIKHMKKAGFIFKESLSLCMISTSLFLVKKDILLENGLFNISFKACEDYDLYLKLTRAYPVGLIKTYDGIKYGGKADQLSNKIKALDRFRVISLIEMFKRETNFMLKEEIKKIALSKLEILINGAIKRDIQEKVTIYKKMLNEVLS